MIVVLIGVIYIIGALIYRSWAFLWCASVYAFSLLFFLVENPDYIDISLSFLVYFSAYLAMTYKLFKINHFSAAFVAVIITVYDLFFALDTLVNHEVETWAYRNHESIVLVLHIALVCLFSKKCNTILAHCWHNINRVHSGLLRMQFNMDSNPRTKSAKGDS
jgi:hypothetical protein